jgi:hypothetical protein
LYVQGVDHLVQLLKKRDNELLEAKEECQDLKKAAAEKEAYYKQQEEALHKEMADLFEKVEKEKKLMAEEAQESATTSVIEAMYELAKEASAAGFSLPSWDLKGWAEMLGKPGVEEQTGDRAGAGAGQGEGAGGSGDGDGVQMGDEGGMNA